VTPVHGVDRIVPMVLVGLLVLLEMYASRRRRESEPSKDRGTLVAMYLLIGAAYGVGFSQWGRGPPAPHLGAWALWVGAAIGLAGVALRLWSVAVLGQYFTYVVKVSPDQKVVETGPYRLIRHPSYTGALLIAVGIALSLRYAWALPIVVLPNLAAYLIRIPVEERALAQGIGEPYRAYMARTKRLIPHLW